MCACSAEVGHSERVSVCVFACVCRNSSFSPLFVTSIRVQYGISYPSDNILAAIFAPASTAWVSPASGAVLASKLNLQSH